MTINIDMADPAVQRLMGSRDLVQLAGDAPDPTGIGPNGMASTYRLNRSAIANPIVEYHPGRADYAIITCDVYAHPGEPMFLHLICPRCRNPLRIGADRKHIELEIGAGPNAQGRLSVEPFECTWEAPGAGKHVPGLIGGGVSLCRWRAAIDNNVAKDA